MKQPVDIFVGLIDKLLFFLFGGVGVLGIGSGIMNLCASRVEVSSIYISLKILLKIGKGESPIGK